MAKPVRQEHRIGDLNCLDALCARCDQLLALCDRIGKVDQNIDVLLIPVLRALEGLFGVELLLGLAFDQCKHLAEVKLVIPYILRLIHLLHSHALAVCDDDLTIVTVDL